MFQEGMCISLQVLMTKRDDMILFCFSIKNRLNFRKQSPDMFCKKRRSQKFRRTLAQVFSCEFCEISKNTFLTEHIWTIASEFLRQLQEVKIFDWYMFIVYWFSQLCLSENCTMNLSQQENLTVLVHLQCWNKV